MHTIKACATAYTNNTTFTHTLQTVVNTQHSLIINTYKQLL